MCSPLQHVLADIFKIELEKSLVPELHKNEVCEKYVDNMDNTICFIKIEYVENSLLVLNGFDNNIEFSVEEENDGMLPFLAFWSVKIIIQLKQQFIENLQITIFIWTGMPLPQIPGKEELWRHLYNMHTIVCSTEDLKKLKYLEKGFSWE